MPDVQIDRIGEDLYHIHSYNIGYIRVDVETTGNTFVFRYDDKGSFDRVAFRDAIAGFVSGINDHLRKNCPPRTKCWSFDVDDFVQGLEYTVNDAALSREPLAFSDDGRYRTQVIPPFMDVYINTF